MRRDVEVLRRRTFPIISGAFTALLLLLTLGASTSVSRNLDADALGVMAVCLVTITVIRRIMGSRIILTDAGIRFVNPIFTYAIPYGAVRKVLNDGNLSIVTKGGDEITSTAFGGSLIDHFVGTADRAVSRIEARMKRTNKEAASVSVVKSYTHAWIADICCFGALVCAFTAVTVGS